MRHLTLGGKRWRVTFPKRINGDGRVGECDYQAKAIRLKGDEGSTEMRWTLFHEVCHVASDTWLRELPKWLRQAIESGGHEERLVELLEERHRESQAQLPDLWP